MHRVSSGALERAGRPQCDGARVPLRANRNLNSFLSFHIYTLHIVMLYKKGLVHHFRFFFLTT